MISAVSGNGYAQAKVVDKCRPNARPSATLSYATDMGTVMVSGIALHY
jgi:hypothetical protein